MSTLLIQVAPQRSTQYSSLANQLAPLEIQISPFGKQIASIEPVKIGGQDYLKCSLESDLNDAQIKELGLLATGSGYFMYHESLGEFTGPFLHPLEPDFSPKFPPDLIATRRYQGKTNEMLTHFMCNIARFSSDFSNEAWENLRIYDPLAGGGTTLFVGLVLGADVAGVEQNKKSAHSTAVFIKQYMQEQHISFTSKEEKFKKKNASRWWFTFGSEAPSRCIFAKGEIYQSEELIAGFKKPHFIVGDLPYGIQHKGGLHDLLAEAIPVWQSLLLPGGSLVFSWDATRFDREEMTNLVETVSDFNVLEAPPFDQMAHRVDRVIKNRDIIVARC